MSSFNHSYRPADDDERRYRCNIRGCGAPVTHICMYQYTSGQMGRVATSRVGRCDKHAEKFIAHYNALVAT